MLDKTYRPAEVEAKHYALWEASGVFAADASSSRRPYAIMMPPPNVTGSLHMGHALNFTLQDILVRYMRMKGRDVLWQPGADHAGIATQIVVERRLEDTGSSRHALGREAFVEKVWEWKAQSGGTITRQLRRLGASPDWGRERFTMDEGLSVAVRKVFVDLYKQGLIYRDRRLVNWDCDLQTAISDLEVVQREVNGHLWHFKYPIEGIENKHITVATTRPETMLGDTAVAVHPEDGRYSDLVGKLAVLPIAGRRIPVITDVYADPEIGSGAVKITPAHDFNDFEVGRRHELEMINVLDAEGRLNENAPEQYRGLDRFDARERIVEEMRSLGLLEKIEDHVHVLPYGDRSGAVIEPWLTDQWFVDAAKLAKPAVEAVESGKTRFVPKNWENTYFEWMRNIQPWCISRQIWWGHRIPAWYGPDGEVFVAMTAEEAAAAAAEHYGKPVRIIQSQDEFDPERPVSLGDGAVPLVRDEDVLDTWFSSALWPFSTLGWPDETPELARYYPSDVLVTGFDIIFFWVARMMMMGLHFMGDVPFRTVFIHALVRDVRGQKMSKSKGNIIDPLELIEGYGCDALRFTLAALTAQGRDIKLSESRVEGTRNFATKLWNAARFCAINGCKPVPGFEPGSCRHTINRWIVSRTGGLNERVMAALEAHRFNEAAAALYRFTWGTFCDWYLEFTKPVLGGPDGAAKEETRRTAAWALDQILNMLHPFMPFITEELWERMADKREGRLISTAWPSYPENLRDGDAEAEMDWVVRLIAQVRAVRVEMNVPPGARIPLLIKDAGESTCQRIERHRDIISSLARLESVAPLEGGVNGAVPKGSAQVVLDEATVVLPLAGVIDVEKEKARLEKEIEKMAREIGKLASKLANESFLAKAPEDVVEENRARLGETRAARAKLEEALGRLVAG